MPAGSPRYLTTMIISYDDYANEVIRRWTLALKAIEKREYELNHFISDVLYVWSGSLRISPLWQLYQVTQPGSPPILEVMIDRSSASASGQVRLDEPLSAEPEIERLQTKGGDQISSDHLQLSVSPDRRTITLDLSDLGSLGLRVPDRYLGEIVAGGETVARVLASVEPSKKKGG